MSQFFALSQSLKTRSKSVQTSVKSDDTIFKTEEVEDCEDSVLMIDSIKSNNTDKFNAS